MVNVNLVCDSNFMHVSLIMWIVESDSYHQETNRMLSRRLLAF